MIYKTEIIQKLFLKILWNQRNNMSETENAIIL